ncbi:MAG: endonuclease NucS [Candidatus Heimdallarchaeota archaeon]|nr:endonuclease NucS [Candidatus Heimdallarchaeota archaeon]
MNRTKTINGSYEELVSELNTEACKKMIIIFGLCIAIFDGRIKSFLPEGDRLLFVKKDETLILHGSKGVKPLNWQIGGAGKINYLIEDNKLIVKTFRPKTTETLEIIFSDIYQITAFDAHDSASLSVYGSEADLSNYLYNNPTIIDKDFQPTTREYETPFGFLDLRGVDREGNIIVIEVKKRNATPADAHQLKRYVEYFQEIEKVKVRGILVAKDFSQKVMAVLQANNLEAVAVPWQEIFPSLSNEKPSTTLDDFLEKK